MKSRERGLSNLKKVCRVCLDKMQTVHVNPDVLWGAPVFPGTRVPVETLTEYLNDGDSVEAFLVDFPSVRREMAIEFLIQGATLLVDQEKARCLP